MPIKKKDFIEIEYTARLKGENIIFDTTDEALAKKEGIHSKNMNYGPLTICVGEQHVIKGLDRSIEGKEPGKYTFEISAEEAFGKKDPKLIQLISTSKFRQQKIAPVPGLQVNVDGIIGTIKTVTGGRTMIDFNHPLSGRDVVYEVKIGRLVTDKSEKVKSLLNMMQMKEADVKVENDEAKIKFKHELPKEIKEKISEKIKALAGLKKVDISKE
jgi:FKBP-type peptidyl-prolyl cis-trans isomerase 2